ncbi:hypothetical protein TNCV_3591811 [Trichonephila clavipes]|nr:hypothetical protein TNCV_3591811 [Trichonephila clavipes]
MPAAGFKVHRMMGTWTNRGILQIRPNRSDYTSRVTFVGGTYFSSKRDSEIVRSKRGFTSICAPVFPIAVSASVPPALFQLVSTQPSSGANITACNNVIHPAMQLWQVTKFGAERVSNGHLANTKFNFFSSEALRPGNFFPKSKTSQTNRILPFLTVENLLFAIGSSSQWPHLPNPQAKNTSQSSLSSRYGVEESDQSRRSRDVGFSQSEVDGQGAGFFRLPSEL